MKRLVALTPQLAERSLGTVRDMLVRRGLSVSGTADLLDAPVAAGAPPEAVLAAVVRELERYDVVLVTLSDMWRWSGLLDGFLGADFRLLACADEPPERNLAYDLTDFVVAADDSAAAGLERAVAAVTGEAGAGPDRHEHALFVADAQSKRSAGLRGGVGCALIDPAGDVVALGTNEVPRAGGGQYWSDSPDDARDLHNGTDPAWQSKMALVRAVLEYTEADQGGSFADHPALAARFLEHLDGGGPDGRPSHDPAAQALESLGRVVHAELAALASAARHGAGTSGAEAVVTRPPCRQCLRQLIVSGVERITFLGNADAAHYPFHADAISVDGRPGTVRVAAFAGVTPRGYGKTFGKRRENAATLGAVLVDAARGTGDPAAVPLAALLRELAGVRP